MTAKTIATLINLKTGKTRAVRADGAILSRAPFEDIWDVSGRIPGDISPTEYVDRRRATGWVDYKRTMIPTVRDVMQQLEKRIARATDGCTGIDPDGVCQHGFPAWPRVLNCA